MTAPDLHRYTAIHSRQTLGSMLDAQYPGAKRSEAEWLALFKEAKARAPSYVNAVEQRADWVRYYISKKVNNG